MDGTSWYPGTTVPLIELNLRISEGEWISSYINRHDPITARTQKWKMPLSSLAWHIPSPSPYWWEKMTKYEITNVKHAWCRVAKERKRIEKCVIHCWHLYNKTNTISFPPDLLWLWRCLTDRPYFGQLESHLCPLEYDMDQDPLSMQSTLKESIISLFRVSLEFS